MKTYVHLNLVGRVLALFLSITVGVPLCINAYSISLPQNQWVTNSHTSDFYTPLFGYGSNSVPGHVTTGGGGITYPLEQVLRDHPTYTNIVSLFVCCPLQQFNNGNFCFFNTPGMGVGTWPEFYECNYFVATQDSSSPFTIYGTNGVLGLLPPFNTPNNYWGIDDMNHYYSSGQYWQVTNGIIYVSTNEFPYTEVNGGAGGWPAYLNPVITFGDHGDYLETGAGVPRYYAHPHVVALELGHFKNYNSAWPVILMHQRIEQQASDLGVFKEFVHTEQLQYVQFGQMSLINYEFATDDPIERDRWTGGLDLYSSHTYMGYHYVLLSVGAPFTTSYKLGDE